MPRYDSGSGAEADEPISETNAADLSDWERDSALIGRVYKCVLSSLSLNCQNIYLVEPSPGFYRAQLGVVKTDHSLHFDKPSFLSFLAFKNHNF